MSLQEVIERSEIGFPEDLNLEQAETLLGYIAQNLPADISYHGSYHGNFSRGSYSKSKDGSFSIGGMISKIMGDSLAFDSFESKVSDRDYTKISAIRFIKIPGYELGEYRPEAVELWDDVRKTVVQWFMFRK